MSQSTYFTLANVNKDSDPTNLVQSFFEKVECLPKLVTEVESIKQKMSTFDTMKNDLTSLNTNVSQLLVILLI